MTESGVLLTMQGKVLASIPITTSARSCTPELTSSIPVSESSATTMPLSAPSSPSSSSSASSSSSSSSESKCGSFSQEDFPSSFKIGNLSVLYTVRADGSLLLTRQRRAHNFSEVVFNLNRHIRPDEIQKREQEIAMLEKRNAELFAAMKRGEEVDYSELPTNYAIIGKHEKELAGLRRETSVDISWSTHEFRVHLLPGVFTPLLFCDPPLAVVWLPPAKPPLISFDTVRKKVPSILAAAFVHLTCLSPDSVANPEVWRDISGNGNDFKAEGDCKLSSAGFISNGVGRYASSGTKLTGLGPVFTLEAWVMPTQFDPKGGLVCSMGGDWYLEVSDCGRNRAYCTGFEPCGYHESKEMIPLNTKSHIAVTFDDKGFSFYINGKLDSVVPSAGESFPAQNVCVIGNLRGEFVFYGAILVVRVFKFSVSPADLEALYELEKDFLP